MTAAQEAEPKAHFRAHPPHNTNVVRVWLWETFGIAYSRPGTIKLMNRFGFNWVRPEQAAQKAFIADYERLKDGLPPDEKVVFADAVHPEHQSQPTHG